MNKPSNTSWAIITAACIGLIGSVAVELIKTFGSKGSDSRIEKVDLDSPEEATETPRNFAAQVPSVPSIRAIPLAPEETIPSLPAIPQLQEKWYVETYHESSTYKAYEGLRVRYEVELKQVGNQITLVGEKMGEVYRNEETEYTGRARTPIALSGTLQWEEDMWVATLEGKEGSTTKAPFPVVAKIKFPRDSDLPENTLGMGEFSSTAASASGPAIWTAASLWKTFQWGAGNQWLLSE